MPSLLAQATSRFVPFDAIDGFIWTPVAVEMAMPPASWTVPVPFTRAP